MLGRVVGVMAAVVLFSSCGGSDGGGAASASHCEGSGPAASVNVDACQSIVDDYTSAIANQCATCCTGAGFPDFGFNNADHCTCGTAPKGNGDTACASKIATQDECAACCDAGFIGYVYGEGVSCQCGSKADSSVCKCSLSDSDPSTSCEACCLHHGYLSMMYIGIGTPECSCVGS